ELPEASPKNSVALKLVPRAAQADYDSLLLVVDQQSLVLRTLVTMDGQGGRSSISFENLKENVSPADKDFEFRIPRGVDVINETAH
ncbi:MAG TPA: outer-membrane lipoprotein carrier protein LolA, partial [Vicinamibacterales bacterium]|nr:outer-membrane lipoprotein carrier protein LolA [Vicinamibacterales bacterium]